jgi:CheY-like chemotaxis protein
MPGMNGLDLAGRLKSMWPQIEIVMFSAMDVEAEARASGSVDRFVRKGDLNVLRGVLDEINGGRGERDD